MTRLEGLADGLVTDAEEKLRDLLDFDDYAGSFSSIPIADLKDDIGDISTGYSFLSHPGNQKTLAYAKQVKQQAILHFRDEESEDQTEDADSQGSFPLHKIRARAWLRRAHQALLAIALVVHICAGAANRGTELFSALVENTAQWSRSVRIHPKGLVYIQTAYNKSLAKLKSAPVVARFLPFRVGQLLVDWITTVRPILLLLEGLLNSAVPSSLLFWVNGAPLGTQALSNLMKTATQAHGLGISLTVASFRQLQGAIVQRHFSTSVARALGHPTADTAEEELLDYGVMEVAEDEWEEVGLGAGGVGMAEQAGHSVRTALQCYGIDAAMSRGLSWSHLDQMALASFQWHKLIGLDSGYQAAAKPTATASSSAREHPPAILNAPGPSTLSIPRPATSSVAPTAQGQILKTTPLSAKAKAAFVKLHGEDATFRANGGQATATAAFFSGLGHLLSILPTGAGKTDVWLSYVLAHLEEKRILVYIAPFVALLQDIVTRCYNVGLRIQAMSGAQLQNVDPAVQVVCISLDSVVTPVARQSMLKLAQGGRLSRVVIDEAHVVLFDTWRHVTNQAQLLGDIAQHVPFLLTTATMPPSRVGELQAAYGLPSLSFVRRATDRPNVRLSIQRVQKGELEGIVLERVERVVEGGQGVIVYIRSIPEAQEWAQKISKITPCSGTELSDSSMDMKEAAHNFLSGLTMIIVCTSAFAAGVDRHDIRDVIHIESPYSLSQWHQAAGRAGRDGLPAEAVVLLSRILPRALPDLTPSITNDDNAALGRFLDPSCSCRRAVISYFFDGEAWGCGELGKDEGCDVCVPVAAPRSAFGTEFGSVGAYSPSPFPESSSALVSNQEASSSAMVVYRGTAMGSAAGGTNAVPMMSSEEGTLVDLSVGVGMGVGTGGFDSSFDVVNAPSSSSDLLFPSSPTFRGRMGTGSTSAAILGPSQASSSSFRMGSGSTSAAILGPSQASSSSFQQPSQASSSFQQPSKKIKINHSSASSRARTPGWASAPAHGGPSSSRAPIPPMSSTPRQASEVRVGNGRNVQATATLIRNLTSALSRFVDGQTSSTTPAAATHGFRSLFAAAEYIKEVDRQLREHVNSRHMVSYETPSQLWWQTQPPTGGR
ncbi:hypothetical protein A4X13_0g8309 [Tilletia indica]|uniref:DNA 3'-5' helicase n=1 Tax=Tilletia indica TaxID=43049 RepID=A0A8T8SGD6_9BASI|nr:hypothetical protein A4X13_0g8309 [Tilletia indica]